MKNGQQGLHISRSLRMYIKKYGKYFLGAVVLFCAGYCIGALIHTISQQIQVKRAMTIESAVDNWGLGFGKAGSEMQPTGNATADELKEYNTYYIGKKEEKVIYLTFDCGYENGNTKAIMDALKKHNAPATFFVVGHFLDSAPDMVKEMVANGYTVANHTYHHPDMSSIADKAAFQKELDDVNNLYKQITGQEMIKYYRPPQGKYSTENLKMAKELGYQTFFWSLAYVDWNVDAQPSKKQAFEKLIGRIHPGAVVLLHNTSSTNGQILDELLTKWEEMGYSYKALSDLTQENANITTEQESGTTEK